MNLRTLRDLPDLSGKAVFIRVDFNVPLDAEGKVADDLRIRQALPTLRFLLEKGARQLVLATHVGRPKGQEPGLRTRPMAQHLSGLMGEPVAALEDWGENGLPETRIVLLENLRFHPGEKSKAEAERDAFGKQLASLADCYVNEAFSNCHRAHASMTSVPKFIPSYAGFGAEKEVSQLTQALRDPARPMVAVIGGLKADKLGAIGFLLDVADKVLVGGALAFALRRLQGYSVGASRVDEEGMAELGGLARKIADDPKLMLPTDAVVADSFSPQAQAKTVPMEEIPEGWKALDIGPATAEAYTQQIRQAKTILWFGPIGVFEMEPFSQGTRLIGEAIAQSKALSIVGGGDSANAVRALGLWERMSLVSTGGGASLEMIEGKRLPALDPLKK